MLLLITVWVLLLAVLWWGLCWRPDLGGALALSYFLLLSLIHVPGALAYVSSQGMMEGLEETYAGFRMTILGLTAFVTGFLAYRLLPKAQAASRDISTPDVAWLYRHGHRFMVTGILVFAVLMPLVSAISSLTSVVSGLIGLLVLASWLQFYGGTLTGDHKRLAVTLLTLPVLPAMTLTLGGFLGFGIQWLISSLCALAVFARRKGVVVLAAPVLAYLGLSLFISYAGERDAIREAVWYERAGFQDRLERIGAIFTNFELMGLDNFEHMQALDRRLNQNLLVGVAIQRIEKHEIELALGSTVPWWALIPRALWPGKPDVGGGGSLVSDFTGMSFDDDTSVGAGQVLEFFVNFGLSGVLAGFSLLGLLLAWLDHRIVEAMRGKVLGGVLFNGLVGLTLLQPGGNLLEVIVSAIAAMLAALIYLFIAGRLQPHAAEGRPGTQDGTKAFG